MTKLRTVARSPASVYQRVEEVISRIRPAVREDGGDLELVSVTGDGVVKIRLHGECVGCPSSQITLHMGIKRSVLRMVPEATAVEQVP